MRRHAHCKHDGAPRASFFCQFDRSFDRPAVTCNDDLPRRIEIGRLGNATVSGVPANVPDGLVIESENSSHRALARRHGILHELCPALHQSDGITEFDRAGAHQRRVLTETMPCHCDRQCPAQLLPQPPGCDAGGQHRWLRDDGFVEFFRRAVLHQVPQVVTQHVAGLGIGVGNLRVLRRQFGQHAW